MDTHRLHRSAKLKLPHTGASSILVPPTPTGAHVRINRTKQAHHKKKNLMCFCVCRKQRRSCSVARHESSSSSRRPSTSTITTRFCAQRNASVCSMCGLFCTPHCLHKRVDLQGVLRPRCKSTEKSQNRKRTSSPFARSKPLRNVSPRVNARVCSYGRRISRSRQ